MVYLTEYAGMRRVRVERATKTQAIIEGGGKYRQANGRRVGATEWSIHCIEHPTRELDKRWDEQQLKGTGSALARATRHGTPSDIRAAYAVWDKLEKEINGE